MLAEVPPVYLLHGWRPAPARITILASSANPALRVHDIKSSVVAHSRRACLAIVTDTRKFATLILVDAYVSITPPAKIATVVPLASMETLLWVLLSTVSLARVRIAVLVS